LITVSRWFVLFLLLGSLNAQTATTGANVINVRSYGAVGDGRVAVDCSILASSSILTCTSNHFTAADVNKAIAVYDSGPTKNSFIQPLATTIQSFQSPTQVTLVDNASNSSSPSSRVVWGTNNDITLANAMNTCGARGGCTLTIPQGLYLTHGINLPCSTIGDFTSIGLGVCVRPYNNIAIIGDGIDVTILENWDPATTTPALIMFGAQSAQAPYNGTVNPITGVSVYNLTLRQVKNASGTVKNFRSDNTNGLIINHVKVTGGSYEGFYLSGIHYDASHLYAEGVGLGGPGNSTALSALNLIGAWGRISESYVTDSGQCIEAGNPHQEIWHIICDGRGADIVGVSPHIGLNISSNTYGTWDVHVHDNIFMAWSGESFFNTLGKFKDSSFNNNLIIDDTAGLTLGSGKETNNVNVYPEQTTGAHGTSSCSNNTFIVTSAVRPVTYFLSVGDRINPMLENWTCDGNKITYATPFCNTAPFQPTFNSADCSNGGVTAIPNGILNVASISGVAQVRISHTTIQAPSTASPFGTIGQEINIVSGIPLSQLWITDWQYNLPTRKVAGSNVTTIPPIVSQ
jgi:hypothetical protein